MEIERATRVRVDLMMSRAGRRQVFVIRKPVVDLQLSSGYPPT